MALVRPNFTETGTRRETITPGRYVFKVFEASESEKLDKNGHNALVVKLEVVNNKNTFLNGQKVSRWLPLGGKGAAVLYRFVRCINPDYNGAAFTTESLIGKYIEADVAIDKNPADGKEWIKVEKVYPYLKPGSVPTTLAGTDEKDVPSFDDFDK
jgi:hypothetical protein